MLAQLAASSSTRRPPATWSRRCSPAVISPAPFSSGCVRDTEKYLQDAVDAGRVRPSRDPAARARYLVYLGIGALLVHLRLHPPADGDLGPALRSYADAAAARARALHRRAAHRPQHARRLPRLRPLAEPPDPSTPRGRHVRHTRSRDLRPHQVVRHRPRARRPRPRRPGRRGRTASSGPTAPGSRPPSASCSACCGPTPARSGCSAATRGTTRSRCTAGWPTCRAT